MQCVTYATPSKIMGRTAADASDLTSGRWAGKAHDAPSRFGKFSAM
jgi:hypothetical protein